MTRKNYGYEVIQLDGTIENIQDIVAEAIDSAQIEGEQVIKDLANSGLPVIKTAARLKFIFISAGRTIGIIEKEYVEMV